MKKSFLFIATLLLTLSSAFAQHQTTRYDSTYVYMEESGLSHVTHHTRIHMDDYTGCANNSVVKIDYDPLSAYVDFYSVKVHHANGTTETLVDKSKELSRESRVYNYVAPARLIYWGASQKMVEVGHLEPGDELEYTTYRKGFTYALLQQDVRGAYPGSAEADARYVPPMKGHFYDIVPFWADQPVSLKVYTVCVPTAKNLQFELYNCIPPHDTVCSVNIDTLVQGDRTTFTLTKHDITPLKREPAALANNDIQCKLLLSTSPDWEAKSMWFYGVNEDYGSFKATPELQSYVNHLVKDAKDELDSISILTHWVADNMRYCGISMGEGEGYTLHSADMNFTDRCGVCKDKASLLISMLRAAGFKAYAAMTMAHERIDRIPADQFNHSVCVVQRRNGQYQLLDPTWVPNVRELWSSAEQQQGYLMGLPQGATLMETPVSSPINHYVRISANTTIDAEGTLNGQISVTAEGQSDASVRGVFSARKSEWRRNLERELLTIDPRAKITTIEYTDPDKYLEKPVSITYNFSIPDYATITKDEILFIPLSARNFYSRAMSHLFFDDNLESRAYPFADRCSRLVEICERVTLPETYTKLHFPEVHGVADNNIAFGCQYWIDGNVLTFAESAVYGRRIYEASDWPAFRAAAKMQKLLASTPVVLTKEKIKEPPAPKQPKAPKTKKQPKQPKERN